MLHQKIRQNDEQYREAMRNGNRLIRGKKRICNEEIGNVEQLDNQIETKKILTHCKSNNFRIPIMKHHMQRQK